jgi:hypothetical protein
VCRETDAKDVSTDQGAVTISATKAVSPLLGVASYRRAVKHLLTSVVREICTLRSVGAEERATALGHPVSTGQTGVPTAIANYESEDWIFDTTLGHSSSHDSLAEGE